MYSWYKASTPLETTVPPVYALPPACQGGICVDHHVWYLGTNIPAISLVQLCAPPRQLLYWGRLGSPGCCTQMTVWVIESSTVGTIVVQEALPGKWHTSLVAEKGSCGICLLRLKTSEWSAPSCLQGGITSCSLESTWKPRKRICWVGISPCCQQLQEWYHLFHLRLQCCCWLIIINRSSR